RDMWNELTPASLNRESFPCVPQGRSLHNAFGSFRTTRAGILQVKTSIPTRSVAVSRFSSLVHREVKRVHIRVVGAIVHAIHSRPPCGFSLFSQLRCAHWLDKSLVIDAAHLRETNVANAVLVIAEKYLGCADHGSPPHVAGNAVKELHIFNRPTEMLKPVRLWEPKADQPRRAKSVANLLEVVRLLEGAVIARHPRITKRGLPVSTVKSSPCLECFQLFRARILCVFHCFILRNHALIVDNSLRFVKNFSRFVLKGLATYVL